jgi:hypothetical protein
MHDPRNNELQSTKFNPFHMVIFPHLFSMPSSPYGERCTSTSSFIARLYHPSHRTLGDKRLWKRIEVFFSVITLLN